MLKILIVFLLYFIKDATMQHSCEAENKYPWSYHGTDNGPSIWGDLYPACKKCGQSPIDFKGKPLGRNYFTDLEFTGYDQAITKATIQNLGWTVMITPKDDVQRTITWNEDLFGLINIVFHFGTESDPGAEHLNGTRHPMEIQFFVRAVDDGRPYVLSVLMKADDDNNSGLDPVTDILPDIMYRNDSTELKSDLVLSNLLPIITDYHEYYLLYVGSKTVPPCDEEYVYWIFIDTGKVGRDQLDAFMTLYSVEEEDASDECLMGPNYRPAQFCLLQSVFTGPYEKDN